MSLSGLIKIIEDQYEVPRIGKLQKTWVEEIKALIFDCPEALPLFRKGKGIFKRIMEEALPICRFVDWNTDFKEQLVTLRSGSQRYDGEVVIDGELEFIEVVNAINGPLKSILADLLNHAGFVTGTSGFTEKGLVIAAIQNKIKKNYQGKYHLLVCMDFDTEFASIATLITELERHFNIQTAFQTITLYERRDKKCYKVI